MYHTHSPTRLIIIFSTLLIFLFGLLKPVESQASFVNSCKLSFASLSKLGSKAIAKPKNIFSESLPSTIVSSTAMLASVQAAKYIAFTGQGADFFTTAFLVTVPLDIGLTLVSHWISLGKVPWLKNITEGKALGPKYEFWSRVAANVTIASTGIVSSWAIANQFGAEISLNPETISAAILLSMLVYPSLQVTKPFLFQKIPEIANDRSMKRVEKILGEYYQQLSVQQRDYAAEQNIDLAEAKQFFMQMLELVILAEPWEQQISSKFSVLEESANLTAKEARVISVVDYKLAQLAELKNASQSKYLEGKRQLLYFLLNQTKSKSGLSNIISESLRFNNLSIEQSISLHTELKRFHKNRKVLIFGASVADQSLAVGFAGAVLLYSTTHWAQTGELPIFIQEIIFRN